MGLLDRAINFVQDAYNYVVGNDSDSKSASKSGKTGSVKNSKSLTKSKTSQSPNSAVNPEGKTVGTIGDTLEKQTTPSKSVKTNDTKKSNQSVSMQDKVKFSKRKNCAATSNSQKILQNKIEQTIVTIQKKCEKFGISYKEAETMILSQMQFSDDEFKNLSLEEQLAVLLSIDSALGLYIVNKGKRSVHSSADKAAVIGQTARNIIEAQEFGGIKNAKEFSDEVGDINAELDGKINETTTDEEYAVLLEKSRKAFRSSLELKRVAEIKKCNGDKSKINEINKKYEARLHAFEAQRQVDFAASVGSKKAHVSIYLRGGKDFSDAHAVALSVYTGKQKTAVADSFTHDFEMDARRRYYEAGDSVSSDDYARAVLYVTQFMSEDALVQFQNDAAEFRNKVEKGEIEAPYMTKEDFEKEAVSMCKGISNNINISDNKKQQLIAKVKNQSNNDSNSNDSENAAEYKVNTNNQSSSGNVSSISYRAGTKEHESNKKVNSQKATSHQLRQALLTMSFDNARKMFANNTDRDFAEVILHDPKLKGHKLNILNYIKSLSPADLSNITKGCSTEMFLFVLRNISPDKAGHLYDLSKNEKCYDARKLGEHIIEEGNKNAVA